MIQTELLYLYSIVELPEFRNKLRTGIAAFSTFADIIRPFVIGRLPRTRRRAQYNIELFVKFLGHLDSFGTQKCKKIYAEKTDGPLRHHPNSRKLMFDSLWNRFNNVHSTTFNSMIYSIQWNVFNLLSTSTRQNTRYFTCKLIKITIKKLTEIHSRPYLHLCFDSKRCAP